MDKEQKDKLLIDFGSLEMNIGNLNYFDEFLHESPSDAPQYTYAYKSPGLKILMDKFKIAEIAGSGSTMSRTINILHWVHSTLRPGGAPIHENNSLELLSYHIDNPNSKGLDCGQYSTVFLELLLAAGIQARPVYLEGFNPNQGGNHVVVIVYDESRKQWMMFDPQHRSYFVNKSGRIMNPFEIRTALVRREEFHCRDYDYYGYWDEECYLTFLAKNIFSFICPIVSEYNGGSIRNAPSVWLHPVGFDPLKRAIKMNKWYEHRKNGEAPNEIITPNEYQEYATLTRQIRFTSNVGDMFG